MNTLPLVFFDSLAARNCSIENPMFRELQPSTFVSWEADHQMQMQPVQSRAGFNLPLMS
jgi:hypothetical protein